MFDKLIELIKTYIEHLLPFAIIYQFQKGVRMRFGRVVGKQLMPGIYLKIPIFDVIMTDKAVETTMTLPAQSILTDDGIEVVVKGVVGYVVVDMKKFFCNVWDTRDAISDKACIVIKEFIAGNDMDVCSCPDFDGLLTVHTQKRVRQYGIKVLYVALTDITKSRSYRLFNENITNT